MPNNLRVEVRKIHDQIDKIAKKGKDNYVEFHSYIDELIKKEKYLLLVETMIDKYGVDITDMPVPDAKKLTWPQVLFNTKNTLQDQKQRLLKSKGLYQLGKVYYKQIPTTRAFVTDISGTGAELNPIVENGGLISIDVLRQGRNYSASASISILGGLTPATASAVIRAGRVYAVNVTATGSYHNRDLKLGEITEIDTYQTGITGSSDSYQQAIGNKRTYLDVLKSGETMSASFSAWVENLSYDKNIGKLYTEAINYLLD